MCQPLFQVMLLLHLLSTTRSKELVRTVNTGTSVIFQYKRYIISNIHLFVTCLFTNGWRAIAVLTLIRFQEYSFTLCMYNKFAHLLCACTTNSFFMRTKMVSFLKAMFYYAMIMVADFSDQRVALSPASTWQSANWRVTSWSSCHQRNTCGVLLHDNKPTLPYKLSNKSTTCHFAHIASAKTERGRDLLCCCQRLHNAQKCLKLATIHNIFFAKFFRYIFLLSMH